MGCIKGSKTIPQNGRVNGGLDGETYFKQFISDVSSELNAGQRPCVYYKYQLDELITLYGDNLEYRYNERCAWWECKLKDMNNSQAIRCPSKLTAKNKKAVRDDISVEQVLEMKNLGLRDAEIARRLKCSENVIRRRLGKSH